MLKQNLSILKALLVYGCDPNRGSIILPGSHVCCEETECHFKKQKSLKNNENFLLTTINTPISAATSNTQQDEIACESTDDTEYDDIIFSDFCTDNSHEIAYDSPLLLVCCLFNRHNLKYLVSKPEKKIKKKYKKDKNKTDTQNIYYNYYYGLNPLDLNQTFLSINTSTSSSTTSSDDNDDVISEIEASVNYLEIDDDLYYQKYDFLDNLSQKELKNMKDGKNFMKSNYDLEFLNEFRLSLVDLFLEHGANEHQYSKLSENIYKYLNKKTKKLLSTAINNNGNICCLQTKPITPLLLTLYFDDLELFEKLYENKKAIFSHSKSDNLKNLIINAVKAESQKCLKYLIKNHCCSHENDDTLFQMISNINSLKIIDLLVNMGTNFKQRNKLDNYNTILYSLFESDSNNKAILSKILQKLLENSNLETYLNEYNTRNELCIQYLFECKYFIESIFFINHQQPHVFKSIFKLQTEFKETISILLKHDANFFLPTGQYNCAIECLLKELEFLIKKQVTYNKSTTNLFCMGYLYDILKEIIKQSNSVHLKRDCNLLTNFFELLTTNELYIKDFETTLKIVKLLAKFEGVNLSSNLIKKILSLWIFKPNYLNSNQSDKRSFIKNLFRILIHYGYNLNETSLTCCDGSLQSNNILHILISILFNCQVGYQADCLYELMIFLVQYGANPNKEPFELESDSINCHLQKRPNYLLAQLCSPFNCGFSLVKRSSIITLSSSKSPSLSTNSGTVSDSLNKKLDTLIYYNEFSSTNNIQNARSKVLIYHYVKFLNFFYEYMDTDIIYGCLKYRASTGAPLPCNCTTSNSCGNILNSHLENLCSNPRSLQSLTRRYLIKNAEKPLINSVPKLPIPTRLQDYLLFNEIK